jgi:MoCo/4Fe-4S cofactor protein with predicted Tat translocation signal
MSSMKKQAPPAARLWRSLAEYDQDPEFQRYLESEFSTPLTDAPPSSKQRRRFMQLMSASFAMAGAAGCRWEQDKLLPLSRRPEGMVPGIPNYFNTAMELGGVGTPLRIKSFDGRPIKVDGNPDHPDTLGSSNVFHQASTLGLFDPDRSRCPATMSGGEASDVTQEEFEKFAFRHFMGLRADGGAGVFVLSQPTSSIAMLKARERFEQTFPQAQWFEYEAVNRDNARVGSQMALGAEYRVHAGLSRADVVLCLDADPLATGPESFAMARGFAAARDPERGRMNRLYVVESALSPTGIQADHRLALRSSLIKAFAVALEREVAAAVGETSTQPQVAAKFLQDEQTAKLLSVLAKDLVAHKGRCAVLVGDEQPPEVHALGHRLNHLLANVGPVIQYSADVEARSGSNLRGGLQALTKALGGAKTLLILDGNPVYTASGDVDFASALAKVPTSIHLGLYRDETARRCTWHAPVSHYLEAWGDSRSYNGSQLVAQPLIAPLYKTKSFIEIFALITRDSIKDGLGLVSRALGLNAEAAQRRAIHDGRLPGPPATQVRPELKPLPAIKLAEAELGSLDDSVLEVTFSPDPKIYDGRFANNGWLQELPEPSMKLTWENAAFVNPATAQKLGIKDSHVVAITVAGRTLSIPALISPGQARGSIRLVLGYGRTEAGVVAGTRHPFDADKVEPVGVDVYKLRSLETWDRAIGASVNASANKVRLATTQDKHPMDAVGRAGTQERLPQIVRQDTFASYQQTPDRVQHMVHHPPLLSLWHEPGSYDGYKWGMTIDLNKCSGCNACVIACNAENNVPVVGKDQVLMGREMHWMRIDRYFQGESADAPGQVHNQPVICQHCEHAPCEQVCPVGATLHSDEGLNDMAYNRCIGTRYCSNNCPYKVRRFNYFNFNLDLKEKRNEPKRMAANPDVTIRFRGVMEKCSFCVQRIQGAKIVAKNARRKIADQEIRTACQEVCPTQAIEFGDLNTKGSQVAKKAASPRGYALLEELNVRPRVTYLARITNPHPALAPKAAAPEHGGEATEGKTDHG